MSNLSHSSVGAVKGTPKVMLQLEGAAMMVTALFAYAHLNIGWGRFALLFLVPDLAMLGYLAGKRVGAICYNVTHSYLGPAIVFALAAWSHQQTLLGIAFIWAAHIGFDRMLGYGLKYATAFQDTHLGMARTRI